LRLSLRIILLVTGVVDWICDWTCGWVLVIYFTPFPALSILLIHFLGTEPPNFSKGRGPQRKEKSDIIFYQAWVVPFREE